MFRTLEIPLALQTENPERQFLSERLAFLMLSKSLAFPTVSFFPNLRTRITVDASSPALTVLD
jgi:hypothetical protein